MEDGFEHFTQPSGKNDKISLNRNGLPSSSEGFPNLNGYPELSKPSTADTAIDLGASLAGDSQFIFPTVGGGGGGGGSRPIRTPGAMSDTNTVVSNQSDYSNFNFNSEETMMVSEVEDVAVRNSRRLHLLSELESRRSHGENLDKLLGEFIERTREEENFVSADNKDSPLGSYNLGKTLQSETRWI